MIKILYDHQMFDKQEFGGISRYFASLIKGVHEEPSAGAKVSILFTLNYYLRSKAYWILNYRLARAFFSKENRVSKLNKNYSRFCILRNDFDIFHPTYYHPYFLKLLKKPFVITVHDMIYELYPRYFGVNDLTAENKRVLIEKASHIIAISQTTKNDLVKLLQVPEERITVVYHGHTPIANSRKPDLSLPETYILFVGSREDYKNFTVCCRGIAAAMEQNKSLKLICAGGGELTEAETAYLGELRIADKVIQYNVSDDVLFWLYKDAMAFVYPSLYEGFGLPILEAFEAQCPVILSNTPSFCEVAGEAAIYFDASDYKALSESIKQILADERLRKSLILKGQNRLLDFSMEKCIKNTIEVYEKCLAL